MKTIDYADFDHLGWNMPLLQNALLPLGLAFEAGLLLPVCW
jgi:hypothetical protein